MIYETLIGTLQPEYSVPWVEPVFIPGHPCYEAYCGMHKAYGRLRQRLGVIDEDADAEEMIDCLLRHGKLLALEISEKPVIARPLGCGNLPVRCL